jgi:hypothetical protein
MASKDAFHGLQLKQKKHDEEFHADIYYLPYPARMTHFVLHFAKYVGRFADLKNDDQEAAKKMEQTLVDTFIVTLSASDVLNLDFDERMAEMFGKPMKKTLAGWADLIDHGDPMDLPQLREWWMSRMAVTTGKMAKALESLDHMEPINVRLILNDGLMEVLAATLVATKNLKIDLKATTENRWAEIAKRRVL